MNPKKFFTSKQKKKIIKAIEESENNTSGEIRLHIENRCESDLLERAKEIFYVLQMHKTERKNGVLIYIALDDKKVAVIGDEGIDNVTPADYWQNEINILLEDFKAGNYDTGIIKVIQNIGDKLKLYFPIESNDVNELPDEISFYNN